MGERVERALRDCFYRQCDVKIIVHPHFQFVFISTKLNSLDQGCPIYFGKGLSFYFWLVRGSQVKYYRT